MSSPYLVKVPEDLNAILAVWQQHVQKHSVSHPAKYKLVFKPAREAHESSLQPMYYVKLEGENGIWDWKTYSKCYQESVPKCYWFEDANFFPQGLNLVPLMLEGLVFTIENTEMEQQWKNLKSEVYKLYELIDKHKTFEFYYCPWTMRTLKANLEYTAEEEAEGQEKLFETMNEREIKEYLEENLKDEQKIKMIQKKIDLFKQFTDLSNIINKIKETTSDLSLILSD